MVRPRTGDFVYSEGELGVMLQDIAVSKEYGVQGVVFGVLTPAGDVDESQVRKWVLKSFRKYRLTLRQASHSSTTLGRCVALLCYHSRLSSYCSLFPSCIRYDQRRDERYVLIF